MDAYFIAPKGNLTSYVFYNQILKELHSYYAEKKQDQICFDFSMVKSIDALVIPNLLCVGYIIKSHDVNFRAPYLYIPDTLYSGKLKKYLIDIKFVDISNKYGLFDIHETIYGGLPKISGEWLNTTISFNSDEKEEIIRKKIINGTSEFSQEFLKQFQNYNGNTVYNEIICNCSELVLNSIQHAKSFAFMTIQSNIKLGKIFISVSDCGVGFKATINEKIFDNRLDCVITNSTITNELDGIIQGIYARSNSNVFGLYPLITSVLRSNGVVRIHSVDTQLVLTSRLLLHMEVAKNKETLKKLAALDEIKNNTRTDLKYGGVHIEIELPLANHYI